MDDIIDVITDQVMAANACFAAGVKAADETSPAALKLRRLIERIEWIEHSCPVSPAALEELRAAIEEAKR